MSKPIDVSIIMPTYNSETTIGHSLESIRSQRYPQDRIEILVIDGGSTDGTIEIAKQYDAKIIYNSRKLPEVAKLIGLKSAKGKYGIYLDSDELFMDKDSIVKRVQLFNEYSDLKNIVSAGMRSDAEGTQMSYYMNCVADPFSNFVYRFNGFDRSIDLCRDYSFEDFGEYLLYSFKTGEVLPLFDAAGNMFDLDYAREIMAFSDSEDNFAADIFGKMVANTHCAAMIKGDFIVHIPQTSFLGYLKKIKWRVKNNVFPQKDEGVGFAARENANRLLTVRKYLFIFYALFLISPIVDSVRLFAQNKRTIFLLHWIFTEYTFIMIVFYMMLKVLHVVPQTDETYGR